MEDFFERIRKPQLGADEGYIRSEVARLRAYLYTLARDEDRQREVERIQIDLFHWFYVALNSLKNQVLTLAFQYAIALVGGVKKELRINHSPQFINFSKGPIETLYDRLDKTKLSQILFVIGGGNLECWDINCTHLPEKQPKTQPREIPPKLKKNPRVMECLQAAKNRGLIDDNYNWMGGKADCALFCACVSKECKIYHKRKGNDPENPTKQKNAYSWKPFEKLLYGHALPQGSDLSSNFQSLKNDRSDTRLEGENYKKIAEIFPFDIESVLD